MSRVTRTTRMERIVGDGQGNEVDEAGEVRGDGEEPKKEAGGDEGAEKERWKMKRPTHQGQSGRGGKR